MHWAIEVANFFYWSRSQRPQY